MLAQDILKEILEIKTKDDTMISACVYFCELNDIDYDDFLQSIDQNIKDLIKQDSIQNNLVKGIKPSKNVLNFE